MATSNTRYRPDWSSGGITAPSVGDVFLDFADRMTKQQDAGLDRAIKQQQLEQEQKRWDITNARAEALAKRQEDEYQRGIAEKTATQEALRATLDPKAYQESKMAGEQAGIQASLANLSPQERAVAEQELKANYDPSLSRAQWLQGAMGNQNVDQSKVLAAKDAMFNRAMKTPGTPEYEAAVKAEKDMYKWKSDLDMGRQLAVARAQKDSVKPTMVTMTKKEPDGSIREIQVPSTHVVVAEQQGFGLGKLSNLPKAEEKGGYSRKDIDKLISGVNTWNITTGDRDSLIEDTNLWETKLSEAVTPEGKKLTDAQINNILGTALTQATSDGGYDSSRLDEILLGQTRDLKLPTKAVQQPATPKPISKEEVLVPKTEPASRTALPLSVVNRIESDIAGLRDPLFGSAKIESYIKDEIDRKYGIGTYDKYK